MSDWPTQLTRPVAGTITSDVQGRSGFMDLARLAASLPGAATWPAANRAIYLPFTVDYPVTATLMGFEIGVQSGNYDIGIYGPYPSAARLVSIGSTALPAAGIVSANIADTALTPGVYWMALCIDNTTATVMRSAQGSVGALTVMGIQDQAVGAVTLPDPATFSAPDSAYVPAIVIALRSTM